MVFVPWESSSSWDMLLSTVPAPTVVVCDGQKGMLLSIARIWPTARIQRCLFHVWTNIRKKITLNPQTAAGQDILRHWRSIWQVKEEFQIQEWVDEFYCLYDRHSDFLKERSYRDKPVPGKRNWWHTHKSVRSVYRQLDKLMKQQQLFTHLDKELLKQTNSPIPRTTNHIEGGTNSTLKGQLYIHRGMPSRHQQKLAEWYCTTRLRG